MWLQYILHSRLVAELVLNFCYKEMSTAHLASTASEILQWFRSRLEKMNGSKQYVTIMDLEKTINDDLQVSTLNIIFKNYNNYMTLCIIQL